MKKLVLALLFASFAGAAMGASLTEITRAIGSGDITALSEYFDQTVEVAILDNEDVYSKAQAIEVVKKFFSQNKPASFSQVHNGASKGNEAEYCIGNLIAGGASFRVYIYVKVVNGEKRVQELRFDEE